ncbi:hypothetical protein K7432_018065, partial [Basidiobolus ranarum]
TRSQASVISPRASEWIYWTGSSTISSRPFMAVRASESHHSSWVPLSTMPFETQLQPLVRRMATLHHSLFHTRPLLSRFACRVLTRSPLYRKLSVRRGRSLGLSESK